MLPPLLAPVTAAGALPWSPEADAPARQTCGPSQAPPGRFARLGASGTVQEAL